MARKRAAECCGHCKKAMSMSYQSGDEYGDPGTCVSYLKCSVTNKEVEETDVCDDFRRGRPKAEDDE